MTRIRLDEHYAEAAVLGGAVLGGGGGGSIQDGTERATLAVRLGSVTLISLDELEENALVLTASVVRPCSRRKVSQDRRSHQGRGVAPRKTSLSTFGHHPQ